MADDERAVSEQVWEAVRTLSASDLRRVHARIQRSRNDQNGNEGGGRATIALATAAGHVQQWAPHDFIHVFLRHLHTQLQQQQQRASPSLSGEDAAASNMSTPTPDTGPSKFELNRDDFPQLGASLAPSTSSLTPSKPTRRRITTTLLSSNQAEPVVRPVPAQVAFPPLTPSTASAPSDAKDERSARPSAWTKRNLLERRMGGGGATTPQQFPPSSPTKSPASFHPTVPIKKKSTIGSSVWATPVKPARPRAQQPEPQPEQSPVDRHSQLMHGFATPPPSSRSADTKSPPPLQLISTKDKRSRREASLLAGERAVTAPIDNQLEDQASTQARGQLQASPSTLDTPPSSVLSKIEAIDEARPISSGLTVNTSAAKLYGFLIANRFVGSTIAELQVLVSLLYRTSCTHTIPSPLDDNNATLEAADDHLASEFCMREHCLRFAELAFNCLEPVIANLGPELSRQIERSLSVAGICGPLLSKLQQQAKQREDLRVSESARIGFSLPIQTKASAAQDFALPFCEETDSRLHYRSPAEAQLYSNRERVRDSFLSLLRQFQRQQHSLLGIENAVVAADAIEAAKALLGDVTPENRWWFAKFFVLELVQVGANPLGESDKDLVLRIMEDKVVGKNPDRLRKLHRRFTSQKPSPPAVAAATPASKVSTRASKGSNKSYNNNNNNNNNRQQSSNRPANRTDRSPDTSSTATSALDGVMTALARVRPFLADSQVFFFHFLHSCDSYEFSRLVTHHLEYQFTTKWTSKSQQSDPRKTFTDDVLQLKVVAKFLGYLRFSPLWHVSSSVAQRAEHNSAFTAAKREGISTLELSTPAGKSGGSGVDVKKLVEDAILVRSVVKCVPWLCDYLCMLSLDKLSAGTRYYRQLFVLLARLYHSPRLQALGEAGLHVAFQVERVFQTLEIDLVELTHGGDLHDPKLEPPVPVLLALDTADDATPGEDLLPFLYNQVFIQTCISELDDLRGYIQARSAPSLRAGGSRGGGSRSFTLGQSAGGVQTQRAHPIRKLRPLQVVLDDNPGATRKLSFFDSDADTQLDSGKRDASPVKRPDKLSSSVEDDKGGTEQPLDFDGELHDDALTNAVFKSSPNLKSVIEFVVDAVATNVCNHAMLHVVSAHADSLVDRNVEVSGLSAVGKNQPASDEVKRSYRDLMEKQLAGELASTVAAALDEALRLGESRVRAAVPALVPPSTHPTMAHSAVAVAVSRVQSALHALIPKTSRTEFVKRVAVRNKSILREVSSSSSTDSSGTKAATGDEDSGNVTRALSSAFDAHAGDEDEETLRELLQSLRQASAELARLVRGSKGDWDCETASKITRRVSVLTRALSEYAELVHDDPAPSSPLRQLVSQDVTLLWDALFRGTSSCLQFLATAFDSEQPMTVQSQVKIEALVGRVTGMLDASVELFALIDPRRLKAFAGLVVDWAMDLAPTSSVSEEDQLFWVQRFSQLISKLQRSVRAHSVDVGTTWECHRMALLVVDKEHKDKPARSSVASRRLRFQRQVWNAVDAED